MAKRQPDDVCSDAESCSYCRRFFHISQLVLVAGPYVFCNNSPSGCRERHLLEHTEVHVPNGMIKYYKEAPEDFPLFSGDLPDYRPFRNWLDFNRQPRKRVS